MKVLDDWVIVGNSSKNNYNKENLNLLFSIDNKNDSIIELHRDFLDEADLSFLFYADATIHPYTVCSSSKA